MRLIETDKKTSESELQKEHTLQSEIQSQKNKIKELQTERENLRKQIDQMKKEELTLE